MDGLTTINVELTNKCNKNCWMCGRRKLEKEDISFKTVYNKEMEFSLIEKIANQVPSGIVIQLHNNGEPLMYSRFGDAAKLFKNNITNIVSNGKLLLQKKDEIIDVIDTLSISIFENDVESDNQYNIIREFLLIKGDKKPYTTLRLIGDVNQERYKQLNTQIITRILHSPLGSFNYQKRNPTIPEIGICLDFLNHLAIDVNGNVSICVRFDPNKLGVIGNLHDQTLSEMWYGVQRSEWKKHHVNGNRKNIPLCSKCEFWGVPTGI